MGRDNRSNSNNHASSVSETEALARDIFIQMAADPSKMQGYQDSSFARRSFELAEVWIEYRDQVRERRETPMLTGGTPTSN